VHGHEFATLTQRRVPTFHFHSPSARHGAPAPSTSFAAPTTPATADSALAASGGDVGVSSVDALEPSWSVSWPGCGTQGQDAAKELHMVRLDTQVGIYMCTHAVTHCGALEHTATHCNTLQLTATHCNKLHHWP